MNDLAARFPHRLQTRNFFPGWEDAPAFIESVVSQNGFHRIADIGGGANPVISETFARRTGIDYSLFDISAEELRKAPAQYTNKYCVDLTAPSAQFLQTVDRRDFDLVFSHMFLEHVKDPLPVHDNIHSLLRTDGIAIHFYPSPCNLPLGLNSILPNWLSTAMVRIAQPGRDLDGHYGKFPAYYKMCTNPSRSLHQVFESMGYKVLAHTGFVGHNYYDRFPLARSFELALRPILVRLGIGMTTAQLLILQKT